MGKGKSLSNAEKENITRRLANGEDLIQIARTINRDPRTVKNFLNNSCRKRTRCDKGKFRVIRPRELTCLKRAVSLKPLSCSKDIFLEAGIDVQSKSTRCRILRKIAKVKAAKKQPPLKKIHKEKRVQWAKSYMKTDFQQVVFTDECRATLDGPDGWSRGWLANGALTPKRLRRQQGGGGIMFWAAIHGRNLIGPFKVEQGVKMDSRTYQNLLDTHFMPYLNSMPRNSRSKVIFMQDNAPSHASSMTREFLAEKGLSGKRLMVWPPCSPDLNPIENYWSCFKQRLYEGGRQFANNDELWKGILDTFASMDRNLISKLTSSMDSRVVEVLKRNGNYIYH